MDLAKENGTNDVLLPQPDSNKVPKEWLNWFSVKLSVVCSSNPGSSLEIDAFFMLQCFFFK